MGRRVKIRVSYDNDAQYMLRLKEAVEQDKRDPNFVKEASRLLQMLATKLIKGPVVPDND